jgi:hypothetical protein
VSQKDELGTFADKQQEIFGPSVIGDLEFVMEAGGKTLKLNFNNFLSLITSTTLPFTVANGGVNITAGPGGAATGVGVTGLYRITNVVVVSGGLTPGNTVTVDIQLNGSTVDAFALAPSASTDLLSDTRTIRATAGDTVGYLASQTGGDNIIVFHAIEQLTS